MLRSGLCFALKFVLLLSSSTRLPPLLSLSVSSTLSDSDSNDGEPGKSTLSLNPTLPLRLLFFFFVL